MDFFLNIFLLTFIESRSTHPFSFLFMLIPPFLGISCLIHKKKKKKKHNSGHLNPAVIILLYYCVLNKFVSLNTYFSSFVSLFVVSLFVDIHFYTGGYQT